MIVYFLAKRPDGAHHSQRLSLDHLHACFGFLPVSVIFTDFVLLQGPAICSDIIITILFTTHFVVDSILRYIFPKGQPTPCIMDIQVMYSSSIYVCLLRSSEISSVVFLSYFPTYILAFNTLFLAHGMLYL